MNTDELGDFYPIGRPTSIKHAEFEILRYLIAGRSTNLNGLSDLFSEMGAELDSEGEFKPIEDTKDKPLRKRLLGAKVNLSSIIHNMLEKRRKYLPPSHPWWCGTEDDSASSGEQNGGNRGEQ